MKPDLQRRLERLTDDKRELLERVRRERASRRIPRVPRTGPLVASFGQQRLWFIDQVAPGNPVYNEPLVVLQLDGEVHLDLLRRVLDALVARHEALRTNLVARDGLPWQVIHPESDACVLPVDLQRLGPEAASEAVSEYAEREASHSFRLDRDPLIRFTVLELAPNRVVLLIASHHVVSDGWSIRVLLRDLAGLYAHLTGEGPPLPPLRVQYADFAAWQRERMAAPAVLRAREYWLSVLSADLQRLELPFTRPRPTVPGYRGAHVRCQLPLAWSDQTRAAAREAGLPGTTRFMVMLTAANVVLHHLSGAEDIAVGTPVANRVRAELEPLVGFFVNTVILRTSVEGNPTLLDVLRRVQRVAFDANEHQEYPFDRLVQDANPDRMLCHQPLINVIFAYHNFPQEPPRPGLRVTRLRHDRAGAKFDLAFLIVETGDDACELQLWYDADLFGEGAVQGFSDDFRRLVEQSARMLDRPLDEVIEWLEGAEEEEYARRLLALSPPPSDVSDDG